MTPLKGSNGDRLGRLVRVGLIRDLKAALSGAETVVVAKVERVSARELNRLRQSLISCQASLLMVKNSLCRRAFRDFGWSALEGTLEGTCGVSPIRGELSTVCKLLATFSRDHEGFVLRGGILKGNFLDPKDLALLVLLPSREVLLSQLMGRMQAPVAGLVGILQGLERKLVGVLHSIVSKKSVES